MAWRIHGSVIRGEVDNRQRDTVRGRLWVKGLAEPVLLELEGNACPDLAGCVLTFENPGKTFPIRTAARFAPVQHGTIGDLTASRKVRVFDIPFEEAFERLEKKLAVPEHMANSLYLEWYSQANGRVVLESADYKLTISPPAWRLTPADEKKRQGQAAQSFSGFIQKFNASLNAKRHQPPEDKEWDEFDHEKFMRECDARTDKYGELLDKYIDHPERHRIIAREMGWTWLEEALDARQENSEAGAPAGDADSIRDIPFVQREELSAAGDTPDHPFDFPQDGPPLEPDPATEGVDWVRQEDGFVGHPLALRTLEGSIVLWRKLEELGYAELEDDELSALLNEYQTTAAKLAGALDGLAYGRDVGEGAFIVACLKRALHHLHAAQGALEKVVPKNLLPPGTLVSTRAEFFALRQEILRLMSEFRRAT